MVNIHKFFIGMLVFLLIMSPTISACGWFTYEDIPGTRSYYNIFDDLKGVEDSVLLVSRHPTIQEVEKNVYIPMIYQGEVKW